MSEPKTTQALFEELSSFNRKLRAGFDSLVRERGMTLARARVFYALARHDLINQRELADYLELETPTLVRILDAMEAQGFIERRSSEGDRRVKHVHITEAGKVLAKEIETLAEDVRNNLVRTIDEKELHHALETIRTMAGNLQVAVKNNTLAG